MSDKKAIEHDGFIEQITDSELKVRFVSMAACASCHASGVCNASDMQDKEVWIKRDNRSFRIGEKVNIIMGTEQGGRAVMIGYVYPFLSLLLTLLILNSFGMKELLSGIISLAILIPYYLIVYLLRNYINQKFSFSIRKYD
ncbi:MAG: SoxR reducing system RseC family protein [Bacteroidales bacterium]|nr:SoxR reducing system RseC family protein [Bacteroidales bacterium]MCF8405877.1 SoxR reducing system RseC family protein [Bacteroidales bacterium]